VPVNLPPIPRENIGETHKWREWFNRVRDVLAEPALTIFHNVLGGLQGGNSTTAEFYHTTAAQNAMFTTGFTAGTYTAPTVTDVGDGTITLGSGDYCFFSDASGTFPIVKATIAGANYALTDGTLNYLVANYNSGTPIISVLTSTSTFNYTTIFPILQVNRNGIHLDIVDWDADGKALPNKILNRIINTKDIEIEPGGFVLGEAATRYVTITSGYFWNGINRVFDAAYNSSVDMLTFYYHVAGVWTKSTITQYNNTQYDDGTNLVLLGTAKYAVNWVFKSANSASNEEAYIVLGGGNYNLAQAEASTVPTNLPSEISGTAFLVGRIIVVQGGTTATAIESAFETSLTFSPSNAATDLVTTTTNVNISGSAAPSAGYHLHANSGVDATWQPWNMTKNSISAGNTCTIPSGFQMAVYDSFTNDGTMAVDGEFLIR